ncbi:MAG: phosphotransferase [Candidatus Schekmanbacteria bacterium]|nr:phosphotransferase [Candidatus Schekmanbacteria bacterium]
MHQYDLGRVESVEHVPRGLIHRTYDVRSERGRFILQRLHPVLANGEMLADMAAVTAHLAARGLLTPCIVRTRVGELAAVDGAAWWRLTLHIGGETFDEVGDSDMAYAAGRELGRFHAAVGDLEHVFRSRHSLHQTRRVVELLQDVLGRDLTAAPRGAEVAERGAAVIRSLAGRYLDGLPQCVVHGDPKISNVVFVPRSGQEARRTLGLIDLDTVSRHTRLVDLGDAARSWCRSGGEDERSGFLLPHFQALLAGYSETAPPLAAAEREALARAPAVITLELAARFLRDCIEDAYFGWDARRYACRRDHNWARAMGCIALAESIGEQSGEIARAVAAVR